MKDVSSSAVATSLKATWRSDALSGFLVFLIALPLCLGIAKAGNCPPIAGVITAIIGGLLASHIGSAPMTIKGPAAGLISIVLGAVTELTPAGGDALVGYRRMLAVGVISAVLQIAFAMARAGKLADFFPSSVIHGMLAAIGVIIFAKQIYVVLGATPHGTDPLPLIAGLPGAFARLNPYVFAIGGIGLAIMFTLPLLPWKWVKRVPAQMVVVVIAVAIAASFGFDSAHHYTFAGHDYELSPSLLVHLPGRLIDAFTIPDFSHVTSGVSIRYIVMFCLIGSIESVASAKAIDSLDPHHHRADLNKDLFATGVANLVAASIGGLPMISEIVRSSANINNGAKSQWSNFFHGLFLLLAVALLPGLVQMIPLAALGAMLVYTGLRLASPKEFAHTYGIGREQFIVFVFTLMVTLATDLLIGVLAGIALKFVIHIMRGVPLSSLFKLHATTRVDGDTTTIAAEKAVIFGNYLRLKTLVAKTTTPNVVLDLSNTMLVDHTVMERIGDLKSELEADGRTLTITGLEHHVPVSGHELAARLNHSPVVAPTPP